MPWRRLLVGATLALAVLSSALAAAPSVGVALDTDDDPATGCTIATADGPLAGVELVVTARIVTTAVDARVDRLERQACAGGALGGPVGYDEGDWAVGLGAGTGGSSVVELSIPRTMLPRGGTAKAAVVASDGSSGSDATGAFRIALAAPAAIGASVPVPLSPWLVVPLALAVALSAAWLARRYPGHGSLAGLLVAFVFTGLAWAAGSFVRDGAIGDWAGIAPAVVDASGDGGPNADVVAAFAHLDASDVHLRIDADIRQDGAGNAAPNVSAGANQTITLPAAAPLFGSATDDGLPNPPGALTLAWTVQSGPGSVSFVNASLAVTSASFGAPGAYVLRLTASDGALSSFAETTITVQSGGGANVAPTVNAGAPQAIALPAAATLAGSATDDGLPAPPAALSVAWTLDSGPPGGIASFTNPASPTSQVSFNAPGSYVLRLTANDGALSASATTTVTVSDGPPALAAIADRTIELGTRLQIVLEAKDGNAGDALVYSLPIAPAGAALRPAPLVDWVPTDAQLGTHPFTARVTDGSGASAARSFNVTVVRTNHAPTIAPQANEVVRGGVTFVRRVVATDPDEGDTLTFDLLAGPPGMAVTGSELAWPTGGVSPGDKAVTVRVRDAAGLADQTSFTLTLLPSAASVAIDDEYEVRVGETLVVPAAGVLANDANPSGAPMSAVKKTDPALGSLSAFGADGAFSFVAPGAVVPPPFGIAEAWRNSLSGQYSYAFPVVGDVNDDGYPDMLLNHQGGTRAVDGRTGATLWNMSGAGYPDCYIIATTNAPVLADVDDDGKLEYVGALAGCERDSSAGTPGYAPQDRIMALDATTGLVKWLSPRISASLGDVLAPGTPPSTEDRYQHVYPAAQYAGMHVARLAPGAAPTLLFRQTIRRDLGYYTPMSGPARGAGCRAITGRAEDDGEACRVTVLMRGDGAVETMLVAPNPSNINQGSWDPWRELAPFTVDVDADGTPEIVSGSDVWRNVGGTWQLLWQSEYEPIQSLAADLDGDGKPEIVHVHVFDKTGAGEGTRAAFGGDLYRFSGLLILDGETGAEKRRIRLPIYWTSWLTIADVDGDHAPDFVWNTGGRVWAIGADGRIRWTYAFVPGGLPGSPDAYSGVANAQVYDLDGDGVPEVVTTSLSELVILDGRTGLPRASHPSAGLHGSFYTAQNVQLVDADSDGHVDILATNVSEPTGLAYLMLRGAPNDWLPGPAIHPQVNFVNGDFSGNGHVEFNAGVPTQFRNPAQQGTVGDPRVSEGTSFTYAVDDGNGETAPATVFVAIKPANLPPVITSTPPTGLLQRFNPTPPGGLHTNYYQVTAFDPDAGDTLTWSLATAPFYVTMDAGGLIRFEPTCGSYGNPCAWGWTFVIVRVTDSLGAIAEQSFMVNLTTTGATVPNVVGQLLPDANAAVAAAGLDPQVLQEVADASPAGTVLAQDPAAGAPDVAQGAAVFLTVSKGSQPVAVPFVVGMTIAQANAAIGALGLTTSVSTVFSPTVPAGDVMAQSPDFGTMLLPGLAPPVELTVSAGAPLAKPVAQVVVEPGPGPLARLAGESQAFKATAVFDDGTSANVTFAATWQSTAPAVASIDATGVAFAKTAGAATVSATIGGKTGQASLAVSALAPGDATPPTAAIDAPADGASVNGPVDVTGTATDPNFLRYELAFALAGDDAWTVIGEGTSPVAAGVLGTFDPTVLVNDLYTLRLRVFDRGENVTEATSTVQVEGQRKVGLFTLTFIDLQVPMAGLPITVSRTYDSRDKGMGEFGVGWRLSLQTLRLRANRVLGTGWLRTVSGPTVSLVATAEHKVSVTLPDGRVEIFDMIVSPTSNLGSLDFTSVTGFVPRLGTRGTLEVLGNRDLLILDGGAETVLVDDATLEDYDPKRFRYTAHDGTVFDVHRVDGVTKVVDTNGNALTFGPGGITHSAGKGVTFARDAKGRIVQIVDPLGNVSAYAYDGNGDLASRTDPTGRVSTYRYDRAHNLIEAHDPAGNRALRNDYDAEGRLVSTTDADGGIVTYTRDPGVSREVIRNRLGFPSIYDYDADGNVVALTDALGRVWTTTFDARGNPLVRTDPLGRTLVRTYDASDNLISQTDEDGNARSWTYDGQGRVLVETDPEGRATGNTYDALGNLVRVDDFEGGVTRHAYDGAGRRTSTTDPLGRITLFGYDASGNVVSITDPAGAVTSATYDAANSPVTTVDALGGTTTRVYDAAGRVVKIVDALGHSTTIAYASVGDGSKPASRTDPLGRMTTYEYDALGRRVRTVYPDGTSELKAYDAEGRETAATDRAGVTTWFARDALGRTVLTTFADGATVSVTFDEVGRLATVVDEAGRTTTRAYATNRETVTEPLGGVTIREFDGSRRIVKVTDALGRILRQTYDIGGHPLVTTYADGTTSSIVYDVARQAIGSIDPLGRTTQRTYDAAGRLATLTDPVGGVTTYGYDANGRMTSRRDANGRVTTYAYDAQGRQLSLTRPGGGQDHVVYDAVGNPVARIDYAGRPTTLVYDTMNRLVNKVVPGGATTTYAYDATGRRTQAGGDRYAYDLRGRLVRETKASGAVLDYARDPSGRVTSLSAPHGSATYTYDARGRMASVTGGAGTTTYAYDLVGNVTGVSHPNGVVETTAYDARDRLVSIAHSGPGGLVAAFAYTLDAAGRLVRVDESGPATDARTVRYVYDPADRLTSEQIETPGQPAFPIAYTYDAAGNRLTMARAGATTHYAYDADDRLLAQTTGGASVTYAWDANGNLASRAAGASVHSYAHDAEDRLVTVNGPSGTVGYQYDADGMRIRRSAGGVTTDYLLDKALPASACPCGSTPPGAMAQVIAERTGAGVVSYTYGLGKLNRIVPGVGADTFLRDAQHSVRGLTTAAGVASDRYTYDAFGVELAASGVTADVDRFAGEPFDPVAGLQYHRARHYDPTIGRFTSTDPEPGVPETPPTFHRYLYAGSNPVDRIDPTGRDWTLPSLTIGQAIQASTYVFWGVTLGARATGYAKDWSEAFNMGTIASLGTLALLTPYSLVIGGELAAAKTTVSLAVRSDGFRVGLHYLRIAAVEGIESIAGKEALHQVETHMANFIQQGFRNPTVRCTVVMGLGGIVVGSLGLLGGNIPGAPNFFASAKVINYEPLAAAMESLVPNLRHTFGCP
jgi:RHS repeat-associated protein